MSATPVLLSPDDFPAVRAVIDTALDAGDVSDSALSQAIYFDATLEELRRRDPLWATRTGAALALLRRAGIYLLAARVCQAAPTLVSETIGRYSATRGSNKGSGNLDPQARARTFQSLADQAIAAVTGSAVIPALLSNTAFDVARGRRTRGY